jgi:membrane protein YdbS with pleckstrin-like domain
MSWKIVLIEFAVYLYNIGFSTVIVLFFAMYNYKRLDITKKASFNWQGSGATQWIMSIPLLLFPYLIYLPFYFTKQPYWGIAAIGIFGIITLLMRNVFINLLTKKFEKQRYKIAEGFRE